MKLFQTLTAFAASTALAAGTLVLTPGAAFADVPTAQPDALNSTAMSDYSNPGFEFQRFALAVKSAESGTTASVTLYSCGRAVLTKQVTGNGSFSVKFYFGGTQDYKWVGAGGDEGEGYTLDGPISSLGPTVIANYTFHVNGKSDSTYSNAVQWDNLPGSCSGSSSTPPSSHAVVKSWSKKGTHNTKVGKKVSVTATKVGSGTHVRYVWKVGSKTVKSGTARKLKIKNAYKGRVIKVVVQAYKGSSTSSRSLRFGRVK